LFYTKQKKIVSNILILLSLIFLTNSHVLASEISIHTECDMNKILFSNDGSIHFSLQRTSKKKRCEIAVLNFLQYSRLFRVEFDFKTQSLYELDDWHSYFQIHAMPDEGENWRCPIYALETFRGKLRSFLRWDYQNISILNQGSCASSSNSIQSIMLFEEVKYNNSAWNHFSILGSLGLGKNNCLEIRLNNVLLAKHCGANIFNDKSPPYLKFGIYKPSGWRRAHSIYLDVKNLEVSHDN
jgi:hypothetical protein